MEQDEITRRNVAILEYMCGEQHFITMDGLGYRKMTIEEQGRQVRRYDLVWEHIMPVVEKITKETTLAIHIFPPMGHDTFTCRFGMGKNHEGKSMIEATWRAVSEYALALKS